MDDVISLGIGEPDFDTPRSIIEAGVESLREGRTHYTSNYGTIELRRALADHLERLYGIRYDPAKELLITVGASEALDLAPARPATLATRSSSTSLPTWPISRRSSSRAARSSMSRPASRMTSRSIPRPSRRPSPHGRRPFLGYPCNPTGAILPDAIQEELARIAERHDLLVYSDEIYDRLAYGSYRHRAFSALPGMRDRTILMGGFSKAYAMTGWRIGWLAAPAALIEGILKIHQYTIMTAPTVAQDAALVAITEGEPEVARMLAEYDRRRRLVVGFNAMGLETFEPRGAFYAFPRITSTGLDGETFSRRLLEEERVAVVPVARSGRRARSTFARATPPRTSASRRPWPASAGSSSAADRRRTDGRLIRRPLACTIPIRSGIGAEGCTRNDIRQVARQVA